MSVGMAQHCCTPGTHQDGAPLGAGMGGQGASASPLPLHGQGGQAAAEGRPHRHRLPGAGILARQPAPGEDGFGGARCAGLAGESLGSTEHSPSLGSRAGGAGVPPAPSTMLFLQPGAPNVLEQGPERRNCQTTRVQLVSGVGQAPPGLPVGTRHSLLPVPGCQTAPGGA